MALVPADGVAVVLSTRILPDRILSLSALLTQQRAQQFRIADAEEEEEDGALYVLPSFEVEEVTRLSRRFRVVGVPFAERLAREPGALAGAKFPIFDAIFPPGAGAVCFSGLQPWERARCTNLVRWMGGRLAEEVSSDVGTLVTSRVSLLPTSKYQAALERRLPIVRIDFLESMWRTKAMVDMQPHVIPPLFGLGICCGGLQGALFDQLRTSATGAGAVIQPLDRAEVVIVKDIFAPMYVDAQRIGILAAPPVWLERCLELGCCVPVEGELEVQNPRSLQLRGGPLPMPGANPKGSTWSAKDGEPECCTALAECVVCLVYLPSVEARDAAKAMAWSLGAFTTLSPFDSAITHVLFKVSPLEQAAVQVSVRIVEDHVSFLDVSWLEACVEKGRRLQESQFPRQRVNYNPVLDAAYATIARNGGGIASRMAVKGGRRAPGRALHAAPSDAPPLTNGVAPPVVAAASAEDGSAIGKGAVEPPNATPAAPPELAQSSPALRSEPTTTTGVFAGVVIALFDWVLEDARAQTLIESIRGNGGAVVYGGSPREAVLEAKPVVCVVPSHGPPALSGHTDVSFATTWWVEACIAEGALLSRRSFPHFEPGPGPLPLAAMAGSTVRITALGASGDSHRKRRRLEELVEVLGAKVAQQSMRWAEITHIVCAMPELMDRKQYDAACRKDIPVVTVQWLFDCFNLNVRQAEERYAIGGLLGKMESQGKSAEVVSQQTVDVAPASFAVDVLSGHDVFVSPSALGSDERLPQMAEELGAKVRTWRSAAELLSALEASGAASQEAASGGSSGSTAGPRHMVVLLESEEMPKEGDPLAAYIAKMSAERRSIFVVPAWLAETFQQRRRLPLDAFRAMPDVECEAVVKRPKLGKGEVGEAAYAWQPAALKSLEELSEDSRMRALRSKAQQKVRMGLRLAELRREPSRVVG